MRYEPVLATVLPDCVLEGLYEQLDTQGSLRWLFLSGEIETKYDFIKLTRSSNTLLYIVVDTLNNKVTGIFWLNGRTSINCGLHMVVLKEYWGDSITIGKECLIWIFTNTPRLHSLLSFIPSTNRLAIRYAKKTGWNESGTIPELIWDEYSNQSISGTMFYITKQEVLDGESI